MVCGAEGSVNHRAGARLDDSWEPKNKPAPVCPAAAAVLLRAEVDDLLIAVIDWRDADACLAATVPQMRVAARAAYAGRRLRSCDQSHRRWVVERTSTAISRSVSGEAARVLASSHGAMSRNSARRVTSRLKEGRARCLPPTTSAAVWRRARAWSPVPRPRRRAAARVRGRGSVADLVPRAASTCVGVLGGARPDAGVGLG